MLAVSNQNKKQKWIFSVENFTESLVSTREQYFKNETDQSVWPPGVFPEQLNWLPCRLFQRHFLFEAGCPLCLRECSWLSSYKQGKDLRWADLEGEPGCEREEPSGLREKAREEARGRRFKHKMDWKESKQGAVGKVLLALLILGTRGPSLGEGLKLLIWSSQTVLCAMQENVRSKRVLAKHHIGKVWTILCRAWFSKAEYKVEVNSRYQRKKCTGRS